jgi:hypothetical protein
VVRGLHFRLGQEQQVPDAEEGSSVDHGRNELPADSRAASLGPDSERADFGLARAPHQLSALRPDLEHDRADELAAVIDRDQHRIDAVGAKLAKPRRVARICRQEAVSPVGTDPDISDLGEVVWMCVPDKHPVI